MGKRRTELVRRIGQARSQQGQAFLGVGRAEPLDFTIVHAEVLVEVDEPGFLDDAIGLSDQEKNSNALGGWIVGNVRFNF